LILPITGGYYTAFWQRELWRAHGPRPPLPDHPPAQARSRTGEVYAVDFCGTKTLREATREQVENFVQQLADWAEKDRNAPICQLNSYSHPKQEVVA